MALPLLVFLLTILVTISSTSPANDTVGIFDLTFYLSCKNNHVNWCVNIFLYEEDTFSDHDFLCEKQICAPPNDKFANVTVPFGEVNPDGDRTPSYEIMFQITHNCSATGEWYCSQPGQAVDVPAWDRAIVKAAIELSETNGTEIAASKGACVHPKMENHNQKH